MHARSGVLLYMAPALRATVWRWHGVTAILLRS